MIKIRVVSYLLMQTVLMFVLKGTNSSTANSMNKRPLSDTGTCNNPISNNCQCHCNVYQDYQLITDAVRALEAKMDQLMELVNKTSPPKIQTTPSPALASSCKELYDKDNSLKSQVYELTFQSQKIPVYCHMGNFGCGDGGWTLAMKTDGTKKTFHFDSFLWSDKHSYNPVGGQTGFDMEETKLPTYWSTPFSKICLGMKIEKKLNFIVIHTNATSLFSLIADSKYRATSLGRNTWKGLIGSRASLQYNCNQEGFNTKGFNCATYSKARIGILGNNQGHCLSCNSRIGFGTGGSPCDWNTCGNEASYLWSDNGKTSIKAMGYILVQ